MWRHFSVVAWPIWHSLFYNGHFSLRWLPISAKRLKSHQIETKTSNKIQRSFTNLSLKLLRDVIFPSLPGQSDIPCITMSNFQWDDYPWKQKLWNGIKFILKPLTRSKVLSENLSLKSLCDVISPSLLD